MLKKLGKLLLLLKFNQLLSINFFPLNFVPGFCPLPHGAIDPIHPAILLEENVQDSTVQCSSTSIDIAVAGPAGTCHALNALGTSALMIDTYDCIPGPNSVSGWCCPNRGKRVKRLSRSLHSCTNAQALAKVLAYILGIGYG